MQRRNDRDRESWARLSALGAKSEVPTREGEARMSSVILELAGPLLEQHGTSPQRATTLISLVVAGWNKAMFPADRQAIVEKDLIERFVQEDKDGDATAVALEVMDFVAKRREELFPTLRKVIVDFEPEIVGDSISLNVTSAPVPDVY